MITIDMKMPTDCNSCLIRKIMGCKIANESGWLNNRRDERCLLKEVVRCKDCKHRPTQPKAFGAEINGQWCYWCEHLKSWKQDDWFCADGRKKDG